MTLRIWVVLALSLCLASAKAHAASVPVGFNDRMIAGGITSPTTLTVLPDGRVLVVQQNGVIRLIQNDTLLPANFWEVPDVDSSGERGCLGIVADPDFATNHFIYVYCTIKAQTSNNQVIRVTENANQALAGSQKVLLALPPVMSTWHIGGAMRFGLDGMLYVAVGNQEDQPQPPDTSNSQNLTNPFGKILRIRADGSVPSDNPFVGMSGAYGAIWSYGFRNPFAFDIQPGTGRMLVGDVGQGTWEEIDDNMRGANYGWPVVEGPADNPSYTPPIYAYQHSQTRCSITGGGFYNPKTAKFPDSYQGNYLFEDFCGGTIEVLDLTTRDVIPFVTGIGFPTNLVVASDGSLYYLARNQDTMTYEPGIGTLNKITYTGSGAPRISRQPADQTILLGDPVTFTVEAEGADRLQWQRDGVDLPGATQPTYTLATTSANDDGAMFTAVASNEAGTTRSTTARLTITTNRPPTAAITSPAQSPEYAPGDMLTFGGTGQDDEDGALLESALTWQVDFQHDAHTHPLLGATSGKSTITFTVPDLEASEANTWLRVHLTVSDSGGATHSVYRDLFPRTQLSSLTPLEPTMNAWGPFERDRSNGEEAIDGQPLSIGGIVFPKGLGVHAPSELRFNLDGRCNGKFLADVGIDDEVGDNGSVVFQVFLDEKQVYDSGVKRGSDMRSNASIEIAGAKQLRLVVTDAGDGMSSDHADWAGARITDCADSIGGQSGSAAGDATSAAGSGASNAGSGAPAPGDRDASVSTADSGTTSRPATGDASANTAKNETADDSDAGTADHAPSHAGGSTSASSGAAQKKKDDASGCSLTRARSNANAGWWTALALFGWMLRGRRAQSRRSVERKPGVSPARRK